MSWPGERTSMYWVTESMVMVSGRTMVKCTGKVPLPDLAIWVVPAIPLMA